MEHFFRPFPPHTDISVNVATDFFDKQSTIGPHFVIEPSKFYVYINVLT